ncbi:uncharacterized protein BT62DRAFT_575536 [Guyanagaster necrorhizus]|uniref:Uncharacterized protein n=1 Tax=Guyanagaster necrorhizus TaxID=856835 RepID=A0A9P7VHI0_9AGAR|nr:uncharacterized protein BT62DRAFT_575536 [Guyanagaster necrorhizus MCA 3950]KAG7440678.1 hypothetical protein BT62DRAFT_575536 [Guyanagaster necrorhizus MCA 3950]
MASIIISSSIPSVAIESQQVDSLFWHFLCLLFVSLHANLQLVNCVPPSPLTELDGSSSMVDFLFTGGLNNEHLDISSVMDYGSTSGFDSLYPNERWLLTFEFRVHSLPFFLVMHNET